MKKKITDQESSIKNLTLNDTKSEKKIIEISSKMSELNKTLIQLTETKNILEIKIKNQKEELIQSQNDLTHKCKELESKNNQFNDLKKAFINSESLIKQKEEVISIKENEILNLKNNQVMQNKDIISLSEKIEKFNEIEIEFKKAINLSIDNITQKDNIISSQKDELSIKEKEFNKEKSELIKKVNKLTEERSKLITETANHRKDYQDLIDAKSEIAKFENNMKEIKIIIEKEKLNSSKIMNENNLLKEENKTLKFENENNNKNLMLKNTKLNNKINSLIIKNEQVENNILNEHNILESNNKELVKQIESLTNELSLSKEKTCSSLKRNQSELTQISLCIGTELINTLEDFKNNLKNQEIIPKTDNSSNENLLDKTIDQSLELADNTIKIISKYNQSQDIIQSLEKKLELISAELFKISTDDEKVINSKIITKKKIQKKIIKNEFKNSLFVEQTINKIKSILEQRKQVVTLLTNQQKEMENKYKKAEQKGEIVIELIRSLGNKLKAFVDINCEFVTMDHSKWKKIYDEIMNENLLNNETDVIKNISQSILDLVLLKINKNKVNDPNIIENNQHIKCKTKKNNCVSNKVIVSLKKIKRENSNSFTKLQKRAISNKTNDDEKLFNSKSTLKNESKLKKYDKPTLSLRNKSLRHK